MIKKLILMFVITFVISTFGVVIEKNREKSSGNE